MTQLFALKMTVTNTLGSVSGFATKPSPEYESTCAYRDDMIERLCAQNAELGPIVLVDGQTMVMVSAELAKVSIVVFEVVDAS